MVVSQRRANILTLSECVRVCARASVYSRTIRIFLLKKRGTVRNGILQATLKLSTSTGSTEACAHVIEAVRLRIAEVVPYSAWTDPAVSRGQRDDARAYNGK